MLRLEHDRVDYGALLKAPEGFVLEAAVGTTYSLQLEPFTLAMISLGLGEDTDSFLKDNPVGMLKAIQYVTDKVVLFHEAGQILVDKKNKNNKLYPLLEKTIVPVALKPKPGESLYPAFHPKMWLLSYVNPSTKEKSYRFVVMSRNLTYDRSWDVVLAFEGIRNSTQIKNSKPIADFLGFLKDQINEDNSNDRKREILDKLHSEVKYVDFETDKDCDLTVLPMGIGSKNYSVENDNNLKITGDPFHELVIFSPFVSSSVIRQFNDRHDLPKGTKRTLIIRDSEIKKLAQKDISKFDGIWCLNSNIISGEDGLSDEDIEKQKQDIHAKIFMFSRDNKSSLYFGSMNASHRAFYTNVELDVRLDCYKSYMGPSKFLDELGIPNGKNNPFELIDLTDFAEEVKEEEFKDDDSKLEQSIKHLCRLNGKANVNKNESGNYDVDVSFPDIDLIEYTQFTIHPLCHNQVFSFNKVLKFSNIELENLSEFYVVTAKGENGMEVSRIITIPTEGIPESRDKKLFNMILDDKRKFFEYISFILSDDKVATALENESSDGGLTENRGGYRLENNVALYEKMLEAALHHRERLEEIEYAIKMLPEDNELKNDFIPLYETFKLALNKE